jgi:hypothetical protein
MNRVWSQAERDYIRANANEMKDKELAAKLTQMTGRNVSLQAVRKQRQKLGISKEPGRGKCGVVGHAPDKLAQVATHV